MNSNVKSPLSGLPEGTLGGKCRSSSYDSELSQCDDGLRCLEIDKSLSLCASIPSSEPPCPSCDKNLWNGLSISMLCLAVIFFIAMISVVIKMKTSI